MNQIYFDYMEHVANSMDLVAYTYTNPQTKMLCYVMGYKNKNLEDRNLGHNMRSISAVMSKKQSFNVSIMGNVFMMAISKSAPDEAFIVDCIEKAFPGIPETINVKDDIVSGKLKVQIFADTTAHDIIKKKMHDMGIEIDKKNFA